MNSIENFPFHHHAQVIYNFTWGCDEGERVEKVIGKKKLFEILRRKNYKILVNIHKFFKNIVKINLNAIQICKFYFNFKAISILIN